VAAELVTPTDELTGLPLPVFVSPEMMDAAGIHTNHHHHFHPRKSQELGYLGNGLNFSELKPAEQTVWLEGKAVRNSRVQVVPLYLHQRYHDFFTGPLLPQSRADKFTATVLACAGVLPRRAIDLSKLGGYREIDLTDKQHRFLKGFKRLHFVGAHEDRQYEIVKRDRIGRFFADYAIEQSAQHLIGDSLIDEFLHTSNETSRKKIGRSILEMAIDESVASLISLRDEAAREGMLRRKRTHLSSIVKQFFVPSKFDDYQRPLAAALRATTA
jgi:hypothetical protein